MALIQTSDYDGLPLEPIRRWLRLKDLLDTRLRTSGGYDDAYADDDLIEYCTVLVNAAVALELGKFTEFHVSNIREDFSYIRSEIIALATKLSIKGATAFAENSVSLPKLKKKKIFSQIERLRQVIASSELSEKQKVKLCAKLDELHSLVNRDRTDFGQVMAIFAYLAATVGGTAAFLADAPAAITTIAAVIGEAKQEEEAEQLAIEAEIAPKQLEDRRGQSEPQNDIPF
ncbi:hypothetical protein [Pseudotabrizicola sp. L79]|uniref:hypothetical protein n=1 Tax=Pseudotabrizicola sp. L79 TaxID=3118402 RepID=UPI002F95D701